MKVQRKTLHDGSITWMDEKNNPLPYTNFVNNQNPVGIVCVVLSRKHNYRWKTVPCDWVSMDVKAAVCVAGQGEFITRTLQGTAEPFGDSATENGYD